MGNQTSVKVLAEVKSTAYNMFVHICNHVTRCAFKMFDDATHWYPHVCCFPMYVHCEALHFSLLPPTVFAKMAALYGISL